jgi:acyl-CoA thioesterase
MKTIEEIREFFKGDIFATEKAGIVIEEAGDGTSKCSMKIGEGHKNAVGSVMGGAIFTLADFAFAVAANSDEIGTVSLNSNVSFLASPKGDTLIAEANPVKIGRSTCLYRIEVRDNLGALVSEVSVTGFKKG